MWEVQLKKRIKKSFQQTNNRVLAVIVDPEIAASAFLWMCQMGLRPEGRPVGLSRAGQRSLTVCKSFNTSVGNSLQHILSLPNLFSGL